MGEVMRSPDGIHVRPTGLRNSFHKFLNKLNPTINGVSQRQVRYLYQDPHPQSIFMAPVGGQHS